MDGNNISKEVKEKDETPIRRDDDMKLEGSHAEPIPAKGKGSSSTPDNSKSSLFPYNVPNSTHHPRSTRSASSYIDREHYSSDALINRLTAPSRPTPSTRSYSDREQTSSTSSTGLTDNDPFYSAPPTHFYADSEQRSSYTPIVAGRPSRSTPSARSSRSYIDREQIISAGSSASVDRGPIFSAPTRSYTDGEQTGSDTSTYRGVTSKRVSASDLKFKPQILPGARNSFAKTSASSKDPLSEFDFQLRPGSRTSVVDTSASSKDPLSQPLRSKSHRRSSSVHSRNMSGNSNINNGGPQRQAPSPIQGNSNNVTNGTGGALNGMNVAMPMGAGQQMDVNLVFQKLVELSEVLKDNREKTAGIVAGAEELATRAAASGANPSLQEASNEIYTAQIASLTHELHEEKKKVRILLREQRENTKLIGEYETAVGEIVEMVRNHTYNTSLEKHAMARKHNNSLQEERDDHFRTRMESNQWMALYHEVVGMLRKAYNLRCEEESVPTTIISALQTEVRILRDLLGWEAEEFEEETGYEFLKDIPGGADGRIVRGA